MINEISARQYERICSGREVQEGMQYIVTTSETNSFRVTVKRILGYKTLGHVAKIRGTVNGIERDLYCSSAMHWRPLGKGDQILLL